MDRTEKWAWIHSPAVDLGFFTLPWLLPLIGFLTLGLLKGEQVCDIGDYPSDCTKGALFLYLIGDWIGQIHRHYTMALSYGDREHLQRHRRLFIGMPLVTAAVLLPLAFWKSYPESWRYPAYVALIAVAVPIYVWNFPHVMMQKYGLLRIYAARLGYGNPKIEKNLILSWMFAMIAWAVLHYGVPSIDGLSDHFDIDIHWFSPVVTVAKVVIYPTAAWAAWCTFRWTADEVRNFRVRNIPKLLYALSIAGILLTGFYSAVVGLTVFAVSHGIEYVALATVYGKHRPPLRGWIRNPVLVNLVCLPATLGLLLLLYFKAPAYFFAYTLFNLYLHTVYDAYIWKMRESPIRTAVLAIGSS